MRDRTTPIAVGFYLLALPCAFGAAFGDGERTFEIMLAVALVFLACGFVVQHRRVA